MDPNDYYPKHSTDREPDYDNSASNGFGCDNRNYDNSGFNNQTYDNPNYNNSGFNNSDYSNRNYNNLGNPNNPPVPDSNGMSAAALVLGIASLVLTCCSGGFGFPVAALGIIFALLSRRGRHMNTQAKVGLGLSIGGIVLAVITVVLSMVILFSSGIFSTMTDMMNQYDMSTESGMEDFLEDWEDYLYEGTFPEDIYQDRMIPDDAFPYTEDYNSSTNDFI